MADILKRIFRRKQAGADTVVSNAERQPDSIPATKPAAKKGGAVDQREQHRLVEERAYYLWRDAGSPGGRESHFWLRAEEELGVRA